MTDPYQKLLSFIGVNRAFAAPMTVQIPQLGFAGFYFSLAGEDAALRQIFKRELAAGYVGTYVDIGCNLPVFISNTYLFYCHGWRGLCVDADSALAEVWGQIRPEDAFVAAAVGEQPGSAYLVKHRVNRGNHFVQSDDQPRGPDFHPAQPVSMRRLDDLFREHLGDKKIDLLSIDIEDSELPALKSNDWDRWRPSIIIMECHGFDFDAPYGTPTVAFLRDRGYRITGFVSGNVVMGPV